MGAEKIIHTTGRNNCGGRCVIHAHVKDGEIVKLTTDPPGMTDRGPGLCACARGLNYHKTFLGPDRLRQPMKRVGKRGEGAFVPISWEEAIDTIVSQWVRIRDTYGPGSRYVNYATGISGLLRGERMAKRLLSLDGGFLDYYNTYSSACIRQATELMYGTNNTGNSARDCLNANLILLWGHNPAESKFGSMMSYLRQAKEKGIPMVVIDPRQNDTALQLGAEWVPIRPATDGALQDAMAYVILEEGLEDREFLNRCCLGFDRAHMPPQVEATGCCEDYLLGTVDGIPKTPQWAEAITGVPAQTIRELAIRYATAKPAALLQGYGPQRNAYGEQGVRGAILLACMTGNVGVPGGCAGGTGLCHEHKRPAFPIPPNPYPRKIPVFLWTDAVRRGHAMTEVDGVTGQGAPMADIKMIVNLAGNSLINQHSDINATAELLRDESKCEFILCSDLFLTSSAKFADILLPGVSMFEGENITNPWHEGEFVGFCNQVIDPLYEGRFEYDWLAQVAQRLGLGKPFTHGRTAGQWLESLYGELRQAEPELPPYDQLKEAGIYRYRQTAPVVAFRQQRENPEEHPFPTPSGKIELYSPRVATLPLTDPFPAIPCYVPPPEGPQDPLHLEYPLQLVGWHTKRRCHSIHDNNQALHALDPQRLWIHPADANPRGIREGDEVLVWNGRGRLRIPAHVTERMMPGVTGLSQGAWYAPDEEGTDRGGSINVLTSQRPTPYARGNPQHTNLVEVALATVSKD